MATNFGIKIAINWLCVNDSDWAIAYGAGLNGRPTECRYRRYPAPKGRCYGNHFLAFDCVLASDTLFDSMGGFSESRYRIKT